MTALGNLWDHGVGRLACYTYSIPLASEGCRVYRQFFLNICHIIFFESIPFFLHFGLSY